MKKFTSDFNLRTDLVGTDEIMVKEMNNPDPEYTTLAVMFAKMAPTPVVPLERVALDLTDQITIKAAGATIPEFTTVDKILGQLMYQDIPHKDVLLGTETIKLMGFGHSAPMYTNLQQIFAKMNPGPATFGTVSSLEINDIVFIERSVFPDEIVKITLADFVKSLPTPKEYTVKLYQGGTANPQPQGTFIDSLQITPADNTNPLYRGVLFSRTAVGKYSVDVMWREGGSSVSGGKLALSFSDGKCQVTGMVTGGSSPWAWVRYTFETYNHAGVLSDDMIYYTNVTFKLYP